VYRDHVWQVQVRTAFKVSVGDPKESVQLALGDKARTLGQGSALICGLTGRDWPLAIRCNIGADGKVSAIFIYRTDI
jgi:hypothetical protein